MSDLYSEIILDHYRNPQNKGRLKNPTVSATEFNPLCGDKVTLDLILDKKGKVISVGFIGEGCAISQAATSMLTEKLIGKTAKGIQAMDSEEVPQMLNIPISAARIKCALLGLVTAKKAAIIYKHTK